MKPFLKHFYSGRGWAHFLFGIAIIYKFMHFGSIPGDGFWHNMARTFMEAYNMHWAFALGMNLVLALVNYGIGFFIEEGQAIFFNAARSIFDERWTCLGAPAAALLFVFSGPSQTINSLCTVLLCVVALYVLLTIIKAVVKFVKSKRKPKSKSKP